MKVVKTVIIFLMVGTVGFVIYRAVQNTQNDVSRTIKAQIRTVEKKMTISGVIQPLKEIEIKSTISGVLEELFVQVGDEIAFGAPIARVQYVKDPMDYKRLTKEMTVIKTRLDNESNNFDRTRTLYNKGIIALEEYENARSNLSVLQSEYNSIASEVRMLQGKYNLNDTSNIIIATDSGTVMELPIKEGGSVMARGTYSEGTTVARIADLKSLIFKGYVLESDVLQLYTGMPMILSMVAAKDIKIEGILSMIAPKGYIRRVLRVLKLQQILTFPMHTVRLSRQDILSTPKQYLNAGNRYWRLKKNIFYSLRFGLC